MSASRVPRSVSKPCTRLVPHAAFEHGSHPVTLETLQKQLHEMVSAQKGTATELQEMRAEAEARHSSTVAAQTSLTSEVKVRYDAIMLVLTTINTKVDKADTKTDKLSNKLDEARFR